MLTLDDLKAFAAELESPRVERKESLSDKDKVREAICAFANDLPNTGRPGYVFVGVKDDGTLVGVPIDEKVLLDLVGLRTDGNILPMPNLLVDKIDLGNGRMVAYAEITLADAPPVRVRGRVWVRPGPRRGMATPDEERVLTEKRVSKAATFDQRPCPTATVADLDLEFFRSVYLPSAVDPEVLAENGRSVEQQLASLRLFDLAAGRPTNGGVLAVGVNPLQFIPGAYLQFVRYDGPDQTAAVVDSKQLSGNLRTTLSATAELLQVQIKTALVALPDLRHEQVPDYPIQALRELVFNAVAHRNYETSHAPVRVNWFSDRVEIQSPGGLFGSVTEKTFGQTTDYRNRVVAEAMNVLGYMERFGMGVPRVKASLQRNGSPEAEFTFEPEYTLAVVRARHS